MRPTKHAAQSAANVDRFGAITMKKKCRFRKKNGKGCGADAQIEKDLCVFHDPAKAADGRRARRAGGINRSQSTIRLPPQTPDIPLRTTGEVSRLLAESINQVRRGQLDARVANTIGFLAGILLKALEQSRVEEGLSHLEAIVGCRKETQTQVFHFIAEEKMHEQSSTTAENN
jgi:hypothetical protein